MRDLPKTVALSLIEVVEQDPPADVEPLHWYLLTTHEIGDATSAWQIVDWYKRRWTIEQLFRILKTQGLQIEDSRVETADRLLKLTAIAAKAAVITLQLMQARDGQSASRQALPSMKTKSVSSTHSAVRIRAGRSCKATLARRAASAGPPGSSPGSAVGTDIRVPSLAP